MTNSPWNPTGPVASLASSNDRVTVVEGSCFCLSDRSGDTRPELPQGLFLLDSRVLSRWLLHVDGAPIEPLAVSQTAPYHADFVGRVRSGAPHSDSDLIVFRTRHVGDGMREVVSLRNYGDAPVSAVVALHADADFADLFAVKENRVRVRGRHSRDALPSALVFDVRTGTVNRTTTVTLSEPADVELGLAKWRLTVPPRGAVELCFQVEVSIEGRDVRPRFVCGQPDERATPRQRLEQWRADVPSIDTDHPGLTATVDSAVDAIGALRIFDPDHPDAPVIAAGAPWFMTLFGRDALLASWMALIIDPTLAEGVLETLARLQGKTTDATTEEEPGRILHEVRFEEAASLSLGGGSTYYGTADATPLFVMLLGELRRWQLGDQAVDRLLPHADQALAWIAQHGDRDGDGYVEYRRSTPGGLANQGWKDSWDGISFADGRLPEAPIALAEVQGYTYAAYLARAHFAEEAGDRATFERFRQLASELKAAFNRDFWLADRGWYAVGLDANKDPIDSLASNMGHCLWTGIVDEENSREVADHLLSPEMFTGFGIRTLASTMGRYNPVSYHNGSVWPHDTAIAAAGLMRYGFVDEAQRVIEGLLDAGACFGGRLPELFAGFHRDELATPAAYPTSCSPQAWAAAAPLLLVRALLRFDPWKSRGRVHVAPVLLPTMRRLSLRGLRVGDRHLDVEVDDQLVEVRGLDGLELDRDPRPSLSRAFSDGYHDR